VLEFLRGDIAFSYCLDLVLTRSFVFSSLVLLPPGHFSRTGDLSLVPTVFPVQLPQRHRLLGSTFHFFKFVCWLTGRFLGCLFQERGARCGHDLSPFFSFRPFFNGSSFSSYGSLFFLPRKTPATARFLGALRMSRILAFGSTFST